MSEFNSLLKEKLKLSLVEEIDVKLDEESKKDFYIALFNERVSTIVIADVLSSFGIKVSKSTILRWRQTGVPNKPTEKSEEQ